MRPSLHTTRILAAALSTVLAVVIAGVLAPQAPAVSLASKRAQAARLDAEVRAIEGRYDELQERYRGVKYEHEQLEQRVRRVHVTVVATRRDRARARDRLADRAGSIYRSGSRGGLLSDLAVTGSFIDFFDRIDMVRRIGDQDAEVLDRIEALNVRVEREERELKAARATAARSLARVERARREMGAVLAQRQSKLDSVNADIRSIMEAQRRAAQAQAAQAARTTAARITNDAEGAGSAGGNAGSSIPLPPGSSTAAEAARFAMGKLGAPYLWAGSGPDSFDCSGLVMWAFAQAGRPGLPHSTYALVTMGVDVPLDQLQVGDLVFPSHNGHMGIYIGGRNFVHAPRSGDVVKVTSMDDYTISHARRI